MRRHIHPAAPVFRAELARSRRFERPLAVTSVVLGSGVPLVGTPARRRGRRFGAVDVGRLMGVIETRVRRFDTIFPQPDGVIVLSPETDAEGAGRLGERIAEATADVGVLVRTGVATFPDDGASLEALLDTARERTSVEVVHR